MLTRFFHLFSAAPGGKPTQIAFSQAARWEELDTDRESGVIRSVEHPFSKDGGLAVLFGNLAPEGCIVKTAGVDESILTFKGTAKVYGGWVPLAYWVLRRPLAAVRSTLGV